MTESLVILCTYLEKCLSCWIGSRSVAGMGLGFQGRIDSIYTSQFTFKSLTIYINSSQKERRIMHI